MDTRSRSNLIVLDIFPSIVLPIIIAAVMFIGEYIYRASIDVSKRFITIMNYSAQSSDGVVVVSQDPTTRNPIQILTSVNERSGIEFAYSFFLLIEETTFSGNVELKHVFHKGYRTAWPLMCPGVFIKGETNTMRVVIGTNKNPYKYADVTNIPIGKWFHVVLNFYNSGLDIYVNANLAHRIKLENEVVYQNFQDIIIFSPNVTDIRTATTPVVSEDIGFHGNANGKLSSMKYARYALSVKEINALMTQGPSKKLKVTSVNTNISMLSDSWWTNQQTA
jgi:hypothetical protein